MKKSSWLMGCLGGFLCLLLASPAIVAAKPIKIGIVDTYSGPASLYSNDVRDAFVMAMDKVN
ncbi:MAG: amino acid ABC transporter substrate-binding protein, partial [Acidobacteriota bacterium]